MYEIKLSLLGLPKTINQMSGRHWRSRVSEVKKWRDQIALQLGWLKPNAPLKAARLTLTRHSTTEPDFDNLASSFKHIIDALVRLGVIEDDKPSVIGSPTFCWRKAKRGEGKIEIHVMEVGVNRGE